MRVQSHEAATDADRLRAALRRTVRAYERHPNFFRLVNALEVVTDPAVSERFMRVRVTLHRRAGRHPRRHRRRTSAAAIAFVTSTVLGGVLRGWSVRGTPISRVYERVDEVVDLVFSGPRRSADPA